MLGCFMINVSWLWKIKSLKSQNIEHDHILIGSSSCLLNHFIPFRVWRRVHRYASVHVCTGA